MRGQRARLEVGRGMEKGRDGVFHIGGEGLVAGDALEVGDEEDGGVEQESDGSKEDFQTEGFDHKCAETG